MNLMKIIIQAGGKGTRLEGLTRNKPKCFISVNNFVKQNLPLNLMVKHCGQSRFLEAEIAKLTINKK